MERNANGFSVFFTEGENIYETSCPILYAMTLIGQKWKLPILWYIADAGIGKVISLYG